MRAELHAPERARAELQAPEGAELQAPEGAGLHAPERARVILVTTYDGSEHLSGGAAVFMHIWFPYF